MKLIPWSFVSYWSCIGCGECCKYYSVNVSLIEGLQIIKRYGLEFVKPELTGFYLKKRLDGRCGFQYSASKSQWLCGLQYMKPKVCKLWPFKIMYKPVYGKESKALYQLNYKQYYVYIDRNCRGIVLGNPNWRFIFKTIPEFIRLAIGEIDNQIYSTLKIPVTIRC